MLVDVYVFMIDHCSLDTITTGLLTHVGEDSLFSPTFLSTTAPRPPPSMRHTQHATRNIQ